MDGYTVENIDSSKIFGHLCGFVIYQAGIMNSVAHGESFKSNVDMHSLSKQAECSVKEDEVIEGRREASDRVSLRKSEFLRSSRCQSNKVRVLISLPYMDAAELLMMIRWHSDFSQY